MHAQLFTLAAAAALLFTSSSVAATGDIHGSGSSHQHRSRAKHVQARTSTMPRGWKLTAACLTDSPAPDRLLETSTNFMTTLTASVCAGHCDSQGFVYAGLQDSHECWCGNSLNNNGTKSGARTDVSNCNMPCAGDANAMCGGNYVLSLYSKKKTHRQHHSSTHVASSSSAQPTTTALVSTKGNAVTSSVPAAGTTTTAKASSHAASSTATSSKASSTPPSSPSGPYKLVEDMSGSNFFSHWNFFSEADPTNGQVDYVTSSVATSAKLAYVENGQAVMKVENTKWLASGAQRQSVRVQSNKAYATGLIVFDIAQMPYGCSVWPAMWTVGDDWPNNGEIDIIENVNNRTSNQLTLHTGPSTSCSTTNVQAEAVSTGFMNKQCASSEGSNAGCGFQESSPTASGAGFNKAGGAVFALLIDPDQGVSIYKFPRSSIPSDISSGNPNPANLKAWGTPQASWPSSNGCKTTDVIGAQRLVFDTTLCGGWAESDYPSSGCPGTCSQMVMDPKNFDNAVWKINSVKVYQKK